MKLISTVKREWLLGAAAALTLSVGSMGCALNSQPSTSQSMASNWETLVDGSKGLDNFTPIGDANWRVVDGAIQADKGVGFLISRKNYTDFEIKAEFWADEEANSGIFVRLQNLKEVTADNSYEINIFDKRPGQEYSTGAIVNIAKVPLPAPKVAGKWTTYDIKVQGTKLTVLLNGVKTVEANDDKHKSGPIALQYAPGVTKDAGVIRFRKVQIRSL
jgi:hypothetical protein